MSYDWLGEQGWDDVKNSIAPDLDPPSTKAETSPADDFGKWLAKANFHLLYVLENEGIKIEWEALKKAFESEDHGAVLALLPKNEEFPTRLGRIARRYILNSRFLYEFMGCIPKEHHAIVFWLIHFAVWNDRQFLQVWMHSNGAVADLARENKRQRASRESRTEERNEEMRAAWLDVGKWGLSVRRYQEILQVLKKVRED
jgi:hypothetical protein